jgi:hypothetical protein
MTVFATAIVVVLVVLVAAEVAWTRPVRESVRNYTELIAAANRQDLLRARSLCTKRYLQRHPLVPAVEGGLIGLPRNIHANFQAWREGPNVWLCPSNRVGPLYQFAFEGGGWRFDGPVGLLQSRGRIVIMPEGPDPASTPD